MKKRYFLILLLLLLSINSMNIYAQPSSINSTSPLLDIRSLLEQYKIPDNTTKSGVQVVRDTVFMEMYAPTRFGPWSIHDDWLTYKDLYPPVGYHYEETGSFNFYAGVAVANGPGWIRVDRAVINHVLVAD